MTMSSPYYHDSLDSSKSDETLPSTIDFWTLMLQDSVEGEDSGVRLIKSTDTASRVVNFNNAGASPSPPPVLRAVASHLALEAIVGGYLAEEKARSKIDEVYAAVKRLINANGTDEIALVESATVGWTRVFYSMAESVAAQFVRESDTSGRNERIILVSEAEYAANLVAAIKFSLEQNERGGVHWRVVSIPSRTRCADDGTEVSTGIVDLQVLDQMLSGNFELKGDERLGESCKKRFFDPESIAMVCVTHVPTNCGIVNPVDQIGRRIANFNEKHSQKGQERAFPNILYLVDACQSAGQIGLDVQEMCCHALTATGRKYLRGPRGTGFLYVRRDVANMLVPSHIDHASAPVETACLTAAKVLDMPKSVDLCSESIEQGGLKFAFKPGAARFEFWESNISGRLGLGAAVLYALDTAGIKRTESRCTLLGSKMRRSLRDIGGVLVYHDERESGAQCGIVTFFVEGMSADAIKAAMLSPLPSYFGEGVSSRFELSVVPATSTPVDSARMSAPNLIRASLTYFNTEDEIDNFCQKLKAIVNGDK